jgi:hypothetical protein
MSDRCIHDFLEGQCSLCQKPPYGINAIVYTTKGGQSFHNWNECQYLAAGQDFALSKGFDNHAINPIQWSAAKDNKSACQWCCAIFLAGKQNMKKCRALIDGIWTDALFAKSTYDGPGRKINQILYPETGFVYFLSNQEVKF